jgi:plastocyanin
VGPYPFATVDYFTGDGTTSEFTLSNTVDNSANTIVTINGVQLRADVDYDLSYPNRIRFIDVSDSSNDPPAAQSEITVRYFQPITAASIPAGSIGINELDVLDGTVGQFLRTDGAGNLSFATVTTDPTFGGSYIEGTVSNASIKENSISIRELAVSPGTIGQVLATDGSGNLAFISVAGGAGGSAGSFFDLSGTIALNQIPDNYIPQSKIDINGTAINGYVLSTDGTDFQWTALTANANTSLNNLSSTAINASLLPATDSTIDLGSNTKKWRDLYLSGSTLYLGTAQITAAGSAINLPAGSTVGGSNIGAAVNNFSTIAVTGQSNVVADSTTDTLTLVSGSGIAITTNASTDAITITNSSPNVSQNVFSTIAVAGQSNVVADSATDTLTLVAGSNITITTDAGTDTITINSAGGATSNSFATIAVAGQSNVVADSSTDTLTLVAGSGMSITTDAGTDTVTIASTVASGIALTALSVTVNSASGGGNLAYNNTTGVFSFTPPDFPSNLTDLSDVTISSPNAGQVLKYNGSNWINDADATAGGAGVGTVTTVSVTSANGFTGTVATASSTPAITIATSITGVLKGNGTAISTATSGTDYAPGTSALATGIVKSTTSTGALTIAVAGTDYQAPIGTISGLVKGNGANALTAATSGTDYAPGTSGLATGIVKSTTTTGALTIAVAGTDYQAPIGTISGLVKGNGANALTAAVAGTDYQTAQSVTGIVKSSGTTRSAAVAGTDYQMPITFTTTGSSGAATFNGTALNIPQYATGATAFTGLSDASSASLTVDKFYLPAITMLSTTNNGASSYRFDQYGTADNPTLYALNGATIAFNLNVAGHPFLIQTSGGSNYNEGLIHVTTAGVVTTGASAQGKTSGTLYWKIPSSISGDYRYICSIHGGMVGIITIKQISAI